MSDPCEWNPDAGRAAYADEAHAEAAVVVGADGKWRLCAACAALPEFKRFRVRRAIRGARRAHVETSEDFRECERLVRELLTEKERAVIEGEPVWSLDPPQREDYVSPLAYVLGLVRYAQRVQRLRADGGGGR